MKLEFSRQILGKNTQISNFMKIRPVGVVPCGRTDKTKLIAGLRSVENAPKHRSVLPPPLLPPPEEKGRTAFHSTLHNITSRHVVVK